MSDDAVLTHLRLARTHGLGPQGYIKLVERYGDAHAGLAALPQLIAEHGGRWRVASLDEAAQELHDLRALGGTVITRADPSYPAPLAAIDTAPIVLSVLGDPALLRRDAVAVIGTRNASANGVRFTERLAHGLARAGFVVVSGLARGIDAAAHRGALKAGGATVAVIATGLDVVYPPEHDELMAEIATYGAVISERPLGATPRSKDFPQRNRIISGLARAVCAMEANDKSGTLITARFAADQGREVFAVPGSPLDERHLGTNRLLRDGAYFLESAQDVIDVLGTPCDATASAHGDRLLPQASPGPVARGDRRRTRQAVAEVPQSAQKPYRKAQPVRRDPPPALTPAGNCPSADDGDLRTRIITALGSEPVHVDDLIRLCAAPTPAVTRTLGEMEVLGQIDRLSGNRVALVKA